MTLGNRKLAGLLLFVGNAIGFLGIIIAETRYPDYSSANNFISDLGIGPSAVIFNLALAVGGLLGIAGSYFICRSFNSRLFAVFAGLSSLGSFLVAVFPENNIVPHSIAALLAFIFGALSAIISYRYIKMPFRYVSVILGVVSLVAFALFVTGINLGLGAGGMERMITYPNIFWSIAFGGYLMADSNAST